MLNVTIPVEIIIIHFRFILSERMPEMGRKNKAAKDIKLAMVDAKVRGAPKLRANLEIKGVTIWEAVYVKTLIPKMMRKGLVHRGSAFTAGCLFRFATDAPPFSLRMKAGCQVPSSMVLQGRIFLTATVRGKGAPVVEDAARRPVQ